MIYAMDSVLRFESGQVHKQRDDLAAEEPLEIRVRGRGLSVTMRTPGEDAELAAGFLLSEGLIKHRSDIAAIEPCDRNDAGNVVNVLLAPHVHVDFEKLTRHVFASSSCGLCGKASIDAVRAAFPRIESSLVIDATTLTHLPARMREAQHKFHTTGGLHAAALFDARGSLLALREDIGRHNAVDKILGYALFNNLLPLSNHVLLVSGRSSFEIMQKSLAGALPIVAAISAPSDLAVQFAQENNQTLIGFLRDQRMNIYTHPQRIRF